VGPLPGGVCWCTQVCAGVLRWVWGCRDAVKSVLWRKPGVRAMGFGCPARTLSEASSPLRREFRPPQSPPTVLKERYRCTGGVRIQAPHNAPAARKFEAVVRVAACKNLEFVSKGEGGKTTSVQKRPTKALRKRPVQAV